jgi:hypothetical protein
MKRARAEDDDEKDEGHTPVCRTNVQGVEQLLYRKLLNIRPPVAELSRVVYTLTVAYGGDLSNFEDVATFSVAMAARAYRSFLLDCLARRRVAALCLLRMRRLVRDMRVLLVKYIVQAEQHEQAVEGMLDFCSRNFYIRSIWLHGVPFCSRARVQTLLAKARRNGLVSKV